MHCQKKKKKANKCTQTTSPLGVVGVASFLAKGLQLDGGHADESPRAATVDFCSGRRVGRRRQRLAGCSVVLYNAVVVRFIAVIFFTVCYW